MTELEAFVKFTSFKCNIIITTTLHVYVLFQFGEIADGSNFGTTVPGTVYIGVYRFSIGTTVFDLEYRYMIGNTVIR